MPFSEFYHIKNLSLAISVRKNTPKEIQKEYIQIKMQLEKLITTK